MANMTNPTVTDSNHSHDEISFKDEGNLRYLSVAFSTASNFEPEGPEEAKAALAANETKAVDFSRFVVCVVLVWATVVVSALVYSFTRSAEQAEFEETFSGYADQITRAVHRTAQNKMEAIAAIGQFIQAHAATSASSWPNVTVPFFEEYIMSTLSLTGAFGVQIFPIVTTANRERWEQYSVEHRGWLNESYAAQRRVYGEDKSLLEAGATAKPGFDWFDHLWGDDYLDESNPDFSSGISSQIFGTTFNAAKHPIIDKGNGPYFPQWQAAPASWYYQGTINSNYGNFDDFKQQTQIVMETGAATYGMAWTDDDAPGYISTLLYPVFGDYSGNASSLVTAFVSLDLFWQAYIEGILPPTAKGVYVIIKNSNCGGEDPFYFTFQIFGSQAIFKGEGDLHEPAFDDKEQDFLFGSELMEPISSLTYTGRPLSGDFCPYTIHVYPSQELQSIYITNMPIWYTVIVCLIFGFTSLVFLSYDWMVERRQRLVLSSATQADAVVSSLFPREVKEQLYAKERDTQQRKQKIGQLHSKSAGEAMDGFDDATENGNPAGLSAVSPIAELYPETTIMFADLVGFTSWSSTHQPAEVFQLLETLYGAFDDAARRRHVFKVETIGDCYVAVAGLPKPQNHHATIMTKFGNDCRLGMLHELPGLAETLGSATLDLALRIGLHSGPVTGGVLRGDKARFQLFGDSMNTAARMEQNSAPNRIHVSESTANLLRKDGKSQWLQPREQKISPKGLGEIQTYWIDTRLMRTVPTDARSTLSST